MPVDSSLREPTVDSGDARIVEGQLDRSPRGSWTAAARCPFDRPTVIETSPVLEDGTPFPTLYYLTCPWLVAYVDGLESACAVAEWAERLRDAPGLRTRMIATDTQYRARRARLAGGVDPTPSVGIAGQKSPLSTKCLHAHVATYLAGLDDPVGRGVVESTESIACPSDLCARFAESDS
jgi:hypothetical protein